MGQSLKGRRFKSRTRRSVINPRPGVWQAPRSPAPTSSAKTKNRWDMMPTLVGCGLSGQEIARANSVACLASGRPLRNCTKAKFLPISQRVFYLAGDPIRGRFRGRVRSGTHSLANTPDLCKSGAEPTEKGVFLRVTAQHKMHQSLN